MSDSFNANSFKLINPTPQYIDALNAVIAYGNQFSTNITAMMQMAANNNVHVMFNPPDNPLLPLLDRGQDLFGHLPDGTPVIMWNPNSASVVWMTDAAGNKTITGVSSAASGFFHEINHALDTNQVANSLIIDPQYDNKGEYVAVSIESVVNNWLGEPSRNNHQGLDAVVGNPTLHTITTEDGAFQLAWRNMATGNMEYGPQISIGSTEWNNLKSYGQPSGTPDSGPSGPVEIPFNWDHNPSQINNNNIGYDTSDVYNFDYAFGAGISNGFDLDSVQMQMDMFQAENMFQSFDVGFTGVELVWDTLDGLGLP